MLLLAIALGSALGGLARYLLGNLVQRWAGDAFPLHTLLINVTGSFLIGFLYRYAAESGGLSPEWRGFLMIGFCGGYTTFSAFSLETVRLIETGAVGRAMAYAVLSVVLSVGAAALGMVAGKR
jgi:fluoride exporter